MKHFLPRIFAALIILVSLAANARTYTPAEVPNPVLADSTQLVSDPDGYLTPDERAAVNAQLLDIRRRTTAEATAVIIGNIPDGYDIDSYATDLFQTWGIGKKSRDNGVLLLVVPEARKYVFRTGYGVEGALPDVTTARIARRAMVPLFRQNQYGQGVLAGVELMNKVLTDPSVRAELVAPEEPDSSDELDLEAVFFTYLIFASILTLVLGLMVFMEYDKVKNKDRHQKYLAMRQYGRFALIWSILGMGLPLLILIPLRNKLQQWRNGRHACPNCGTDMHKLDEVSDNAYLTPAQDAEERLNSVDYDVWLCPSCNATDIYAYSNPNTAYTVCPKCQARACALVHDTVLRQPTTRATGEGVRTFLCRNCGNRHDTRYTIPRREDASLAIVAGAAAAAAASRRGDGGGFGGGFGGGSFGGGSTGGGGSSGSW